MKRREIQWIGIFSIVTGCAIIMLQGYWLYNQYKYNTSHTADELETKTLLAWDNYKRLKNRRLKNKKEKLKGYNTNLNQNTIYISDKKENSNLTNWDIVLSMRKLELADSTINKHISTNTFTTKEIQYLLQNANEVLDSYSHRKAKDSISDLPDTTHQEAVRRPSPEKDHVIKQTWMQTTEQRDSLIVKKFKFSTIEDQSLVYDAVNLYLAFQNSPFDKNEMDSLIAKEIGSVIFYTDTSTLPTDSVLWKPKPEQHLRLRNPSVTVSIPYNILDKKMLTVTVPVPANKILQTMFWQIIITFLLLLLLIVALSVQIKTILDQIRVNKLRKNFVNTTLHELKRPVQTLKSIVAFLQNQQSETSQLLTDARVETDNLTSYLQKLREVNEGESISDSIHLSHFDFTHLVHENIKTIRRNTRKTLHIATHFPQKQVGVTADKTAMNNVLANLLENAVKYSGEVVDIDIRIEHKTKTFCFSLSDQGSGIARSEQNKVLEPFYRSKNEKIASLPGMGLGLSYVKMIVDAHKGHISIRSEINKGTTVRIEIPQ